MKSHKPSKLIALGLALTMGLSIPAALAASSLVPASTKVTVDGKAAAVEAHPQIHIEDTPQFYDMEVFNRSVQTGHLLMSLDCWTEVHPSLVTLPVDWNFTIPYGLLYQLRPGADVARFVALVRGDGPA